MLDSTAGKGPDAIGDVTKPDDSIELDTHARLAYAMVPCTRLDGPCGEIVSGGYPETCNAIVNNAEYYSIVEIVNLN